MGADAGKNPFRAWYGAGATRVLPTPLIGIAASGSCPLAQARLTAQSGQIPHGQRLSYRRKVLECGGPPPLSKAWVAPSASELAHSRPLPRRIPRQTF